MPCRLAADMHIKPYRKVSILVLSVAELPKHYFDLQKPLGLFHITVLAITVAIW